MKRIRPDAAALEKARQAASAQRVAAGLPREDPGDALYEQLHAERWAAKKRPKGKRDSLR